MSKRSIRKRRHRADFKEIIRTSGLSPASAARLIAHDLVEFGKSDWLSEDTISMLEASLK